MAPITLPPSFYNSFWSPDYRTGLDVLFRQLEAGSIENKDVASFIEVCSRVQRRLHCQLSGTSFVGSIPRFVLAARRSGVIPCESGLRFAAFLRSRFTSLRFALARR